MKWKGKDFNIVTRAKGFYAPLKWKDAQRIFVNPWSDFFIEDADEWRDEAMGVIRATDHIYMILTKRIECANFERYRDWPWPNVWLGVSVENQRHKWRIEKLRDTPAAMRFLSLEPLLEDLGELDLEGINWVIVGGESTGPGHRRLTYRTYLDESGRFSYTPRWVPRQKALQWVRSLRDQCQAAGVPFFFKQWGGPRPNSGGSKLDRREWKEIPQQ